uniref:Major facilitator superfamily (MFS) profile domain-containing protein n=1 Tax=Ditylenchus dipsaci TaxID=166011 RepID=A0A915DAD6_9BILA
MAEAAEKGLLPFKRDFSPSKITTFGNRYRYFILGLGWLCLTSISSNMIALNFTLICMSPPVVVSNNGLAATNNNDSAQLFSPLTPNANFVPSLPKYHQLRYSPTQQGTKLPLCGPWLYTRYGARYVLFGAGLLSAVATALIPLAAVNGLNYFLVLRFLQGIAYSADFAAMGVLCSRWASLKQNALFISVLTCYSALSTAVTNPIAGLICESNYGWPMVYYGHAVVCVVLFMFWLYFYNDHPRVNRFVSDVELEKINRNKTHAHINMDKFIPYKAILSILRMYLLMYQPSYFKYVLNYSIEQTGFLGALPSLSHMPLKFFFGWASDKIKCWPERKKLIIFNSVAVCLPGVCYAVVGFMPDDKPMLVVMLFTLIHMLFSTAGGGFYKCGTLCARQYSQFIIANIQFVKCLTLFVGPALMAIFVSDETDKTQWRNIFISLAVMLFFANILFCREATDVPAKFTEITAESWKRKKLEKKSTAKSRLEQKSLIRDN